jgi:predicted ThiF/HesA family dinucleotide-utilizing enzyme
MDPIALPDPQEKKAQLATLDSLHAEHVAQKRTVDVPGQKQPVLVEPWHLAAIKASARIPGNRELTEENFHKLVADVVQVSIGGAPKKTEPTK